MLVLCLDFILLGNTCDHIQQIANGYIFGPHVSYSCGTPLTYKCNTGFEMKGDKELICDINGQFKGKPPSCIKPGGIFSHKFSFFILSVNKMCCNKFLSLHPVLCEDVAVLHSTKEGGVGPYSVGQAISLKCNPCYKGGGVMWCLAGGKWDKMVECSCKKIGRHGKNNWQNILLVVHDRNKVWTPKMISVSGESCGVALKISHGSANTSGNILCGDNASYSCSINYIINGSSVLHCTPQGFQPEAPTCVEGQSCCQQVADSLACFWKFISILFFEQGREIIYL